MGLARAAQIPQSLVYFGAGFGALVVIAHGVVRCFAPYADPLLLPCVVLLNGLGLVLIHRLDLAQTPTQEFAEEPLVTGHASQQLIWTVVGVGLFTAVLVAIRDHLRLRRYIYTLGAAGLVLLALPAVLPASISEVNGARLWIQFGAFSIQPAEFAKIALIIFFAGYLASKREALSSAGRRLLFLYLPRGRDLGPVLGAWVASMGVLVLEGDLGTSLLFFGIFVMMLYVATRRVSWLVIGGVLFTLGALVASQVFSRVQERVFIWLHPFAAASGESYQLVQAMYGLAAGGLIGTGLGQGRPGMVPFAKTDFIIATLGEELGLAGLMAVLLVYGVLVERGLRVSLAVHEPFSKLLAAGLSFAIAVQVFVVAGGVTRLIPLTGLTTPFLSYGGSSLVANWAIVALLLRISDASRRPAAAGWDVSHRWSFAATDPFRAQSHRRRQKPCIWQTTDIEAASEETAGAVVASTLHVRDRFR